ncbi:MULTISPECIES: FtsL-like putative cell division protein [Lutimonas]|uniref:FtsL-like putative cell division protein n=1 Tax=Lutimonas TaxID=449810 RepID=UPI001CD765A9|nr:MULTISPECIES: FtsL-like putative cell division protein [Lutimonas]MCA0933597.1 S-adenosyl-methyltransferase [Lutimonas saemankumensis]WKK65395.1 FtsL-like putative cell division protein [Lutimonas sp. YSD2104]
MSKVKQTLYNILKGKFLVDEDAKKNWGFIIFLTFLALLMITSSHQIDKKVQKISSLNKEKRKLYSEFVATRSDLMKLKMESSISKRLEEEGLYVSQIPPQKIKVIVNK